MLQPHQSTVTRQGQGILSRRRAPLDRRHEVRVLRLGVGGEAPTTAPLRPRSGSSNSSAPRGSPDRHMRARARFPPGTCHGLGLDQRPIAGACPRRSPRSCQHREIDAVGGLAESRDLALAARLLTLNVGRKAQHHQPPVAIGAVSASRPILVRNCGVFHIWKRRSRSSSTLPAWSASEAGDRSMRISGMSKSESGTAVSRWNWG